MAIFHLSTKPIKRSAGRSATASIAYRVGMKIEDERTGLTHDYSKRAGVVSSQLLTPNNINIERSELWNLAEKTETRKNSRTAREIIVNIPHELNEQEREQLVADFSNELVSNYGVAVDYAIHTPDQKGDQRNHHAHILMTTRKLARLESGRIALTDKSQLEMSDTQLKKLDLPKAKDELKLLRKKWADMSNQALEKSGIDERIDHRSHKDRGLTTTPTIKVGVQATQMERRGIETDKGNHNRAIQEANAKIMGLEAQIRLVERQKIQNKAKVPKNPQNANTSQSDTNTDTNEPSIEQKREILGKFRADCDSKAEKLHQLELDGMVEKAKPKLQKIKDMRANKPINPFKAKDWQKDLDRRVAEYEKNREQYQSSKAQGATDRHLQAVYEGWKTNNPEAWNKVMQYQKDVRQHDQQRINEQQQKQIEQSRQRRAGRADSKDRGR